MTRRNFQRQTASLRKFLQTGTLGPISLDLVLLDVAALIGPPRWWVTDVHDFHFPLDWGYSGLEISFSVEQPHRIERLKIDPAALTGKKFHSFCQLLGLSLDDLPIKGRPSAMLSSGVWGLDGVKVGIHPDPSDPKLSIDIEGIELLYAVFDSAAERFQRTDIDQTAALLDKYAFLLGIYAHSSEGGSRDKPPERWHTMRSQDYLQIVA